MAILDEVEMLQNRVLKLESKTSEQRSYAEAASAGVSTPTTAMPTPSPANEERLDRLEYLSSEQERSKRLLEVRLTHPLIIESSDNLSDHVKNFMVSHMNMTAREVDTSFQVRQMKREHTVLITFSHVRFKRFFMLLGRDYVLALLIDAMLFL